MTRPRYFAPGARSNMKGGLEKWVPNGVYNLTRPQAKPPTSEQLRREYGLQFIEVRNNAEDNCYIGQCVVFDRPVLDVDYEPDVYFRGRDNVWMEGYPGQPAGTEADPYIAEDNVVDAAYGPNAEIPFGRANAQNRFSNWGIAIDPIAGTGDVDGGGTGRIAIGGAVLCRVDVRHPAMRYIEPRFDTELYREPRTTFMGNGEILWMSENAAQHPFQLSTDGIEARYCLVRLGNSPQVTFTAYTATVIPSMDISDAVNPTVFHGDVNPMRKGYDLTNPFEVLDNKLRTHASNWNGDADEDISLKAFNFSETDIPAGVYVTVYWDANSRCFVAIPPPLDWGAYYVTSGGSPLTWTASVAADNLDLSYSSGVFTASRPMRLSIDATLHLAHSSGTLPYQAHLDVERDTGSGFVFYRRGSTGIHAASINECAVLATQVDLAAGDDLRFTWGPTTGPPAAAVAYGDLKLTRKIKA